MTGSSQRVSVLEYARPRTRTIHWPTTVTGVGIAVVLNLLPYFIPPVPNNLAHYWDPKLGWPKVFLWDYCGVYVFQWQRLMVDLTVMPARWSWEM